MKKTTAEPTIRAQKKIKIPDQLLKNHRKTAN
jgi:hypothetical protein